MSRQAQLLPRCPLQKKTATNQPNVSEYIEVHRWQDGGPHKSISRSSTLDEQPPWFTDLLSDSDTNPNVTSDSSTLFNGNLNDPETQDSCEPDNELESSCTYGPNSPRRKDKLGFPEKEIVSAFSDYVMQNPLQHLDGYFSVSGVPQSNLAGDSNTESIQMKRHPGQKSRVRKVQYIAELERTVDILENVGSELGLRVASMLQPYAALSHENNTLKKQMLEMQHQKYIDDGEYSSLKREVEMLKIGLSVPSSTNKVHRR